MFSSITLLLYTFTSFAKEWKQTDVPMLEGIVFGSLSAAFSK